MSTPSWPRMAGWLANPRINTARGRWRARRNDVEHAGTFAYEAPQDWAVLDDSGRPSTVHGPRGLLQRFDWDSVDYKHAAGEPVDVEHDGRPAWRVQLDPPPHKPGRLALVVDAATCLCVAMDHSRAGLICEITDLEVDVDVDESLLEPARRARAAQERQDALWTLCDGRVPPTPRWFPWRRCYLVDQDCLVIESDECDGVVARAPLGQRPAQSEFGSDSLVRVAAGGWSWAVSGPPDLDEQTARRVIGHVIDRFPYEVEGRSR